MSLSIRLKATLIKLALPRHKDVPLANQSRKRLIRRERVRIHFGIATTEQGQHGLVQCCLKIKKDIYRRHPGECRDPALAKLLKKSDDPLGQPLAVKPLL
jgi:hypothetical protein